MIDLIRKFVEMRNKINTITREIGVQAVNFSKQRFAEQSWVDDRTEPWKKRKSEAWGRKARPGRALLVDSGRLKRSIRIISLNPQRVVIGTDVAYAQVHNEGFRGDIEQTVRAHTRKRTRFGAIKERSNKTSTRISFGRVATGQTSEVKEYERTLKVNIPRRQFLGQSAILNQQINRIIIKIFKEN